MNATYCVVKQSGFKGYLWHGNLFNVPRKGDRIVLNNKAYMVLDVGWYLDTSEETAYITVQFHSYCL